MALTPVPPAPEGQLSCKFHLLVIDELGFVALSKTGCRALLFEVFSQRYERGSRHPGDLQLAVR